MNEDDALNILKTMCTDNFCIEQLKIKQAIEIILDLYQQEQEKNKELRKKLYICTPEVPHTQHKHYISYVDLVNELYKEKEKNKSLKKQIKAMQEYYKNTDFVFKDKIREKIKSLEEKIHIVIPNEYNRIEVMNEFKNEGAVDVLKDLLEEE